jgi:catechol 2,3-dioxygenase-like lactoylglutathione lyase family enzyme
VSDGRVVAVGHVGLGARDLARLADFYRDTLGLKQSVYYPDTVAIFEAGDADLFLAPGAVGEAEFDLASDDVDALRTRLLRAGVQCSEPKDDKRTGHRSFAFTDPDGNTVRVTSAHRRT